MQDLSFKKIIDHLQTYPELKYHLVYSEWQSDFLRFYQSQTNYNISKDNKSISLTLYQGKRSFGFNLDAPDTDGVLKSINQAMNIIGQLPEDPDFEDIENDLQKSNELKKTNNIESIDLEKKVGILKSISSMTEIHGFDIFGTFICNYHYTRVMNSNGIDKQQWNSPVYFEVKAVSKVNQVTVLHTFGGEDFTKYNQDDFISQLEQKILFACNPVTDIEPGEYDVILAPRCVAELMQYLCGGMSARSYDQKSSFFQDKLGQKVFPENITISDSPSDSDLIRYDYNQDGHIYQPLTLVKEGVFKAFMSSCYYAHKTGLPKNGNTGDCLILHNGDATLESMTASIEKGLYISSLHYMNYINEKETSVTGLTRDGTFLIEHGKITQVVNNLRFTEKLSRIFENIVDLESSGHTVPFSDNYEFFEISSAKAPHVLVKLFNITSSTHTI